MPTVEKAAVIQEMTDKLGRARGAVLIKTEGLTVAETQDLRRKLRAQGIELHVVKNTLLRIASEKAEYKDLSAVLTGQTAIAMSFTDEVGAAKAIADFLKTAKTGKPMVVKAGILDKAPISAKQVEDLAKTPPRDQLRGQMVGTLMAPLNETYGVINAPLRDLINTLEARIRQLGGAEAA